MHNTSHLTPNSIQKYKNWKKNSFTPYYYQHHSYNANENDQMIISLKSVQKKEPTC